MFIIIYFFLIFFINLKDTKEVIKITILNFLLASPAIFYIFFLDVFFISIGGLSVNYYNKIGVIASILFFHLIPILIYKNFYLKNLNLKKEIIFIFISIILSMLVILNFDYNLEFTGGGIILHFSNYILGNNSLFFMLLPFTFFLILKLIAEQSLNNMIIFIILLFITPQYHIFHKYYDPLIFIISLTIFKFDIKKKFISMKFIYIIFGFYLIYYFVNYINYYYLEV